MLADLEHARLTNTFELYSQMWLEGRHDIRPSTRASYRSALRRHLVPAFGPLPIEDLSPALVRAWFASYGTRTPTARAHAYQLLGSIMAQAEDDGLITRNPCRIKSGGRSAPRREPEVLTMQELFRLAEAMPERHRALTLLCGLCGLSFGEAAALRRRDVDLERGIVRVTRTAVRADGGKSTGPPKSRAGLRDVAMPDSVTEALREHMSKYAATGRDALVFPPPVGRECFRSRAGRWVDPRAALVPP
ncbi:MAG: tyrosine-type recombinase/integrase [Dermatophilaceae bacterium]|nr:site-specific integrase [Intrasporangiaceae bacterium]